MWLSTLIKTGGPALYQKICGEDVGKFRRAGVLPFERVRGGMMGKVAVDLILKVLDKLERQTA